MAQIAACMKKVDRLIVAIGSAEHRNTKRNPFSGAERARMLRAYLNEMKIDTKRVKVVTVKDARSYSEAISNLFKVCGKVDVVFLNSASKKDRPLARMVGRLVLTVPLPYKRRVGGISATKIRAAIANGKEWEHMTGSSVARYIRKHGIKRIRSSYSK
jgi:nicotinamide mononucleotide adenylyltransferase